MGHDCLPSELRTLFLFEGLDDRQLASLCEHGHVDDVPPGPVCREGEPATCFYVLLDGELVMSKRSGDVDVETNRTSQRGVYCGAWSAYVPGSGSVYEASVRVTRPSRFFVLDAGAFASFMRREFPMAVHLLEGQSVGRRRTDQIIGQREKLLALGTITAGLTHELNNPAAAIARAAADLAQGVGKMRHELAALADGTVGPQALRTLITLADEVAALVGKADTDTLGALEVADREERIDDWLDDHDVDDGWVYAPTFVEAGLDTDQLDRVAAQVVEAGAGASLQGALGWLRCTIDTEQRMAEIAEASRRISGLLAGAKQYSQMDRGEYQSSRVHELIGSTVRTIFGDRVGKDRGVRMVWEKDPAIPEILCYPGDLNQVWTNLIDNAVQAMGGRGTLTVRTAREGEDMVRVEICDDGPGIPPEIQGRIFTPFFTTKPFGQGTGLGLDLAWRIVVEKHRGDLRVASRPGDTRFLVLLPIVAPAPGTGAGGDDTA